VLTVFGLIHSVDPAGGIYLPWQLSAGAQSMVWQFVGAYVALAIVLFLLSLQRGKPTEVRV